MAWLRANYPDVKDPAGFEQRAVAAFPGVDLLAEAIKARGWELSDNTRRKHRHGKFLWGWYGRAQDWASKKAPSRAPSASGPAPAATPDEFAKWRGKYVNLDEL
jgi:hypothetical protein